MRTPALSAVALGITVATAIGAAGQPSAPSESTAHAAAFARLMQTRALDAIAVADPTDPGRYAAALVFPGTQILFITGRYSAPVLMNERLLKNDFKGAYMELNGAAAKDGRLFVQDMGANGLRPARSDEGTIDIVYEAMVTQTTFDGEWSKQKLSREAYAERFQKADARYAHALQLFIADLERRPAR